MAQRPWSQPLHVAIHMTEMHYLPGAPQKGTSKFVKTLIGEDMGILKRIVWFCLVASLSLPLQCNWNPIVDSFDEMSVREALLWGIYAYGFEKPSAIQQRAIVPCIKGNMYF